MFGRLLIRLLRGSGGRLTVALIALASGAAVISTLANLDLDVQRKLTQEFRTLGANVVIAPAGAGTAGAVTGTDAETAGVPALLDDSVLNGIEKNRNEQLVGYAPYLYIVARASTGTATGASGTPVVVSGTWLDQTRSLSPTWKIDGEQIASRDDQMHCLLGQAAARALHASAGNAITLTYGNQSVSLTVTGIVTAGGTEDNQVFVNLPVAQRLASLPGKFEVAQLSVSGSSEQIEGFAQRLDASLPSFTVHPIREIAAAEGTLLAHIRLLILLMVVLILALTSLCVMATMAALAMERREDVGLMKALGGSISRVVSLFMAEAGVLGAAGAILGYLLGTLLTVWAGHRVFDAAISPRWEVFPLTLALMIGVSLAAALPLRLLGNVKPAAILRGE